VAAAEEGPGRERRLDPGEGGEAWATLLQDPRWRGLAVCEAGARFGFAAKVASVPVLAASVLPGGAVAAGSLLSAAGLAGLAGAPLGGWLTDRAGARATAAASAAGAGAALLLVPSVLAAPAGGAEAFGGASASGLGFCGLVLLWSVAVAAEGPALVAVWEESALRGAHGRGLGRRARSAASARVLLARGPLRYRQRACDGRRRPRAHGPRGADRSRRTR